MNKADIYLRIKTQEDADKLIEEVDLLVSSSYEGKGQGLTVTLNSKIRAWIADSLKNDPDFLRDPISYLEKLKKDVAGFEKIEMAISYQPTYENIERLSQTVKRLIGVNTLIKLIYDPTLLGGAVVIYKGNYRDYTLKKIFDNEFSKMKVDLFKIIAH